ncbi:MULTISPECIES: hypothetical protein [Streptomyces]|uniref:hypothetical protein n=1 Tax=Streptomyces TaxID=1883 RepID=UPI00142D6B4C|nr:MULTISPECIES: hypothetical protein [Streptomyces]
MLEHVDFFEAVVTAYPNDADHAPLLEAPVHARPPTWSACGPTRTSPGRCCGWSTRR